MYAGIDTDMKDQQLHQLQCLNRYFETVAVTRNNVPHMAHTKKASNGLSLMVSIFSIIRSLVKSMVQWCNGAMVQPAAWRPLTDLTVELRQPLSDSEGAHWHPEWVAWAAPSRHITTYHDIS